MERARVRIAAEFLASYPDAKVDLTMGERTIDLIDEGFDLAIRLALPPDSSLIVRSLATWRHVLCCSPAYLEKYGPPQQLSELAERNCVRHLFYPYGDDWHFVDRKGAPASVRVSGTECGRKHLAILAPDLSLQPLVRNLHRNPRRLSVRMA